LLFRRKAIFEQSAKVLAIKDNYGDRLTSFTFGSTVRFVKFSMTPFRHPEFISGSFTDNITEK